MDSIINFIYANFLLGITSFGGGKAYIPMYQAIFINKMHLISQEMLTTAITYATALPGPIASMMTTYIAFVQFNSWIALIFGLLALSIPPMILYMIAYSMLNKYINHPIIIRITMYLSPAIIALLIYVVFDLFFNKNNNLAYYIYATIVLLISTIVLLKTQLHPIVVIIISGIIGYYVL